jgi:type II secretory pathway component PulK
MASNSNSSNRDFQKGFALIIVIWVGVLLALMAAAFSSAVRSRIRSTSTRVETLRAESLANAGVRIALLELLAGQNSKHRFVPDGTILSCAIGNQATLVIQLEDESGKVSLNATNTEILVALFTGLGAKRTDARTYVDRISDFRDNDSDKRSDGAERDDYIKAGINAGPKNSNFTSTDELDQVLGLPLELRARAKPFLTTQVNQNGIDLLVAPKTLKALLVRGASDILSGVPPDSEGTSIFDNGDLPPQFTGASPHTSYSIRAEAILTTGARFVSEALVELTGGSPLYRRWRRGTSRLQPGQALHAPTLLPPC